MMQDDEFWMLMFRVLTWIILALGGLGAIFFARVVTALPSIVPYFPNWVTWLGICAALSGMADIIRRREESASRNQ
jgi:uncharacterized protein involved in cysteine biosynthesis